MTDVNGFNGVTVPVCFGVEVLHTEVPCGVCLFSLDCRRLGLLRDLHAAAYRLSNIEASDSAYSDARDTVTRARAAYYRASHDCRDAGIDVTAELKGKGYLL